MVVHGATTLAGRFALSKSGRGEAPPTSPRFARSPIPWCGFSPFRISPYMQ